MNSLVKTRSDRSLVIGVTTLWLLIPIVYGIDILRSKKLNIHLLLLILVTILANNASVIHWRTNSTRGTITHRIDVTFARILFLILVLLGLHKRKEWLGKISSVFSFFVSFLYFLSEYLFKIKYYDLALLGHLTFRFIGFWWVHTTVAAYNNISLSKYFNKKFQGMWSFVYYLHALVLTIYSRKMWQDDVDKRIYDMACITLVMWILFCGILIKKFTGRMFS